MTRPGRDIARLQRDPAGETLAAKAWLENYVSTTGDRMPVPASKHKGKRKATGETIFFDDGEEECEDLDECCPIRLPHVLRKDVYEEYQLFCIKNREMCVSDKHFFKMWRKEFPHVGVTRLKGTLAMCSKCALYTSLMKTAPTTELYEKYAKIRQKHIDFSRRQREVYYRNRNFAMDNKEKCVSMIMDGMDQRKTYLPVVRRREKNDRVDLIKQKLLGVKVHGHGNFVYVAQPPLKTGANFTLECFVRTINKLDALYQKNNQALPSRVKVQLDNASDNKAYVVLAFMSFLVEREIFEEVDLNFLMVGHTHEDIDQYFSVISRKFNTLIFKERHKGVYTFEEFQGAVRDAFLKEEFVPRCVDLVQANHDFQTWLSGFIDPDLQYITCFRHFRIRKCTANELLLFQTKDHLCALVNKAALFAKEYMSHPDDKYDPSPEQLESNGPIVVLLLGDVVGEPDLEQFKGLARESISVGREGREVDNAEELNELAFDEMKAGWLTWIDDPVHGASNQQKESFKAMVERMVTFVEQLPEATVRRLKPLRLPLPLRQRRGLPSTQAIADPSAAAAAAAVDRSPPRPLMAYRGRSSKEATAERRKRQKEVATARELQRSREMFPEIKKGMVLLCKTIEEESELPKHELAISQHHLPEQRRTDDDGIDNVEVQWMSGKTSNGSESGRNDLNALFRPWFMKGSKAAPYKGVITRESVEMIGIKLVGRGSAKTPMRPRGYIFDQHKKEIAALGVGFTYDGSTKQLVYEEKEREI